MAASEKTLVYLVLGAAGSGRRQILADLIDAGLTSADRAAVLIEAGEVADAADGKLPNLGRWTWRDASIEAQMPAGMTHVFLVASGRASQVDQVEAFKGWLELQDAELGRILAVVNCQLVAAHSPLLAWYEACVHFADVVLLTKREGVENKWLSDFLTHFKKQYYPCVFETVKAGRVKNPALVLDPQARRMTHVFDEEQDWILTNAEGEEVDEEDENLDEDEELQAKPEEDPYFVRRSEGGRRLKELPDINKFL
ncbi:hypothetical protein [Opitutus sp. ER46]|uniref:hypothetical protein n=1 Tax=Opitutus sp. ER46 TaxID=2161864 RepID=UPI000D307A95|nr:hypothetical protein [Opitutus sp. ER46]PTX91651.1 hypothetical protein DB354_17430 [Opitutus sp. ER46]